MEIELLTFGFGHTLMDLYQSLYFELFPCIIYIYIVENVSLTSYFEFLCSMCAKSNSAAYSLIFASLYCVTTLKVILILKLNSCLLYVSHKNIGWKNISKLECPFCNRFLVFFAAMVANIMEVNEMCEKLW